MSQLAAMAMARDLLVKLSDNTEMLRYITSPGTYNMLAVEERKNAIFQLRMGSEVLCRVSEIARMDAELAHKAAKI